MNDVIFTHELRTRICGICGDETTIMIERKTDDAATAVSRENAQHVGIVTGLFCADCLRDELRK